MKKVFMFAAVLFSLMLSSCGKGKSSDKHGNTDSIAAPAQIIDTAPQKSMPDSTVYGRSEGFGMSAFTLVTEDGREFDIALTSETGEPRYGKIYGDRSDTARYAMTTRHDNEELDVLINLSQLEKFISNYEIYNCHVIIKDGRNRDWVEIEELNDSIFRAKGKSGKNYEFRKQ